MKSYLQLTLVAALGLCLMDSTCANQPRDASSKARGDIYRYWVGRSAQNHARDQARSLYYYGQTQPLVASPQAQQHVRDVRQNLGTSQKALAELKQGLPENKAALEAIAKIEAIHQKVLGHCNVLDKELSKEQADGTVICDCCIDIHADLEAADAEMVKLMKALGIEKLEIPAKGSQRVVPEKK